VDDAVAVPVAFLISDVDGTLVTPDKTLTESAVDAVRSLRQAGVGFSLISSRPPRGMAPLLEKLAVDQPFAAFNGGSVLGPGGDIIERLTVPPEAARRALALFERSGIDSWVFARGEWWLCDPKGVSTDRERRTLGFEPTVTAHFENLLGEVDKIVGVSDDYDRLARVEIEAQALLAGLANAVRSQSYYLDVTHPAADKGHGVRAICRYLNLDRDGLAVIGDMANDLAMFAAAGFAVAMGQAPPAVRAAADAVTGPNTQDGFADAVRRFIVPRAIGSAASWRAAP
jgi:Cof subfamily protein (haloacid dehalogenase superfamily)